MGEPKITPELAQKLRGCPPASPVEVVVEMCPLAPPEAALSRAERIDALKAGFEAIAQPVAHAVEQLGGEITGMVWLNQTLLIRIPADAVDKLDSVEEIRRIDVPHRIERE